MLTCVPLSTWKRYVCIISLFSWLHAIAHSLQYGVTALMIAIYYGSSTVLEVLFRATPDVNVATYVEVYTYMHILQ